jgi:signal transduction histidine kinase
VVVTAQSVLFLLVVAGLAAFLFSDQRYLAERRIQALANQRVEASELVTVATLQEALRELAGWFRCSHALLAFWNEPHDHFCLCRYPPVEGGENLLEDSREWSVCRGERLDFLVNDVKLPEGSARSVSADFDLHPHLVRKFQVYNALGCGLHQEDKAFGRLLLLNRVSPVRPYHQRRLRRVAPAFTRLARHVLVIKAVEHAAYERERARVAQDFHDGPLQSVISFQMRVHTIRKLLERDTEAAGRELDHLQEIARKQVTEMRTFVNSMRPVEVDTSSLTAAARRLVEDFQKESGVPVTFLSGEQPVSVPGRVGVDILQIIREALHNIHKHAQATHVIFSLEQNDTNLAIGVSDNGKGFRFGGRYSLEELDQLRLGPNSIKQRMRALGGDLLLESQPGHGTSLRMKIPLY